MSIALRLRRAPVCVLMLVSMLLALATAKSSAASVPVGFYGVNSGPGLVNDPAGRPTAFGAMRAGGLSFVRADASWSTIEPIAPIAGLHAYAWSTYDLFVADLARNGLRWYPMLGYAAPWATSIAGNLMTPPASDAAFGAFVAAFADRYGPAGTFWSAHPELPALPTTVYEVWNEPSNDTFWNGAQATPARYMALYLAARAAIKAVDPAARVTTAGLLDSAFVDGQAYLRAMLASAPGARDQIDALGWHPYVGDTEQIGASIARARSTLDQHGLDNVPIEISEVGWHSGVPAPLRAGWIRQLAATLPFSGLRITRLLPYVWSDDPGWQLTNPDGSPGTLGGAYFAGIRDSRSTDPVAAPALVRAQPTTGSKICARTRRQSPGNRPGSARRCASGVRRTAAKAKTKAATTRSRR